jgi:hypothetical protein
MPKLTPLQIAFIVANAVLGLVIGLLHARIPAMQATAIPLFGWLVAGVLILDLAFGWLGGAHPTAVVSMPARIVALVVSYIAAAAAAAMIAA